MKITFNKKINGENFFFFFKRLMGKPELEGSAGRQKKAGPVSAQKHVTKMARTRDKTLPPHLLATEEQKETRSIRKCSECQDRNESAVQGRCGFAGCCRTPCEIRQISPMWFPPAIPSSPPGGNTS